MRLSAAPLLSATLLALPSWSAPTSDTTAMQVFPDVWVRYDLDIPVRVNSSTTLERRVDIEICQAIATGASCTVLGLNLWKFVSYLGGVIKDASNQRSCGTFSGSAYGIAYRYKANGKKCDTTAEQKTISGAIEHHLQTVGKGAVCNTECLDLTHGGSWDGFLLIGPANNFDYSIYCGPSLSFGDCSHGGKKDFQ